MGAESRESRSMGAGILSISIALVACVVLAQQNAEYFAGFGWALIHGVGLLALRALFPFFIGLAAVGLAFAYLRQRVLAFAAACVAIVGVNETMLARTPAKKAAAARSAAAVEVRNVRDEVFRTPQGNPIGIRILFEAVFPETGVYSISPTGLVPVGMEYPPPEIAFDHLMMPRIEPEPGEKDYHDVFETGVVYAFAYDFMPSFVSYHEITKPPCFAVQARYTFSREDFEAAMLRYRTARYRTQISVRGGEGRSLPQKLWDYETSAEYDLVAMRETAEREGAGHCKEEHSFPKVKRLMTNYERSLAYRGPSGSYQVKDLPFIERKRGSLQDTRGLGRTISDHLTAYGEASASPAHDAVAFFDYIEEPLRYRLSVYDPETREVTTAFTVAQGQTEYYVWMADGTLFVQYSVTNAEELARDRFAWVTRDGREIAAGTPPFAVALRDAPAVAYSNDGKTYLRRGSDGKEQPWFHCERQVEFKTYDPANGITVLRQGNEKVETVELGCSEGCVTKAGWEAIPRALGCAVCPRTWHAEGET